MKQYPNQHPAKPAKQVKTITPQQAMIALWSVSLLVFTYLHLSTIHDDGDLFVSSLGVWESDEGTYTYNATSLLRYGEMTVPHSFNTIAQCPVLSIFHLVYFKLFGISLWASRVQGMVAILAAQALLFFFWKRENLLLPGLVTLMMTGLNYLTLTFSRSSGAEAYTGFYVALATLAMFRLQPFSTKRGITLALIGLAATLTKPTLLVVPSAITLFLIIEILMEKGVFKDRKKILHALLPYFGALALLALLLKILWINPNQSAWDHFTKHTYGSHIFTKGVTTSIPNLWKFFLKMVKDPWHTMSFVMTLAGIPILVNSFLRKKVTRLEKVQIWSWCVIAFQFVSIGMNPYQPPRYYSMFSWAWGINNAVFFFRLVQLYRDREGGSLGRIYRYLPAGLGVLIALILMQSERIPVWTFAVVLILGFLVAAGRSFEFLNKHSFNSFAGIMIVVTSALFFSSYGKWQSFTSDSYYRALLDINTKLPEDCVLMGRMAGFVALEHPCRVYRVPQTLNGTNPPPDFVMLNKWRMNKQQVEYTEINEWQKDNPKVAEYLKNGWDESFRPLQYTIMRNYYTRHNTIIFKVKKDNAVQ